MSKGTVMTYLLSLQKAIGPVPDVDHLLSLQLL